MSLKITETTGTDCLLIVDSDEAAVQNLSNMLGKVGFEIFPTASGQQALDFLAKRRPDLILMDLRLADMDGFELCRRVQENRDTIDIPVIFISADSDKNLVAKALEHGGVDYIAKPVHKQELLSRVRTQLMLKTARDYARRLAQDKDEMMSMISHHLQNHLVGMHMSAQMLLDRAKSNPDTKLCLMAENIKASSGQMRAFLKAFLANAAADHGLSIRLESISLTDAVLKTLQQYEDAAKAKGITLNASVPGEGVTALADPAALTQILDNLVSNAIKFSPTSREVMVTVLGGRTFAEVRVKDQGVGFTESDKARMFQRYTRLSARPTGGEPSTGLGLNIVKKLVQAMNGELTCESTAGKGATFIVKLRAEPNARNGRANLGRGANNISPNLNRPQIYSEPVA